MHIALIPPKGHVGMLSHLTRFHLVVPSQLVYNAEKHLELFHKRGHYVILDNGVFEGDGYSIEELLEKGKNFANEIVLPDKFQDADRNFTQIMENINAVVTPGNWQKRFRFMVVPQGKDEIEWVDNFHRLYEALRPYQESYVWGMPKWLGKEDPGMRSRLLQLTRRHTHNTTWHMLGCNSIAELQKLVTVELQGVSIRSLDTSLPFKLGISGVELTDTSVPDFSSSHYFGINTITEDELELCVHNVVRFLSYANYEQYKAHK